MKIDSTSAPRSAPFVKETRASNEKKTSQAADNDVQLSGLASQLRTDNSTFDAARVSEIKKAIAEGRFTINADAIADRLITSAKELVNHRQV